MLEEWRDVAGWPYQISSLGRVRNAKGRILAPRKHTNGYLRICLCGPSGRLDAYIHRLVAMAFLGGPPQRDWHADHKDRQRDNNAVENLRWLSPEANRATRRFSLGEERPQHKLTAAQVRLIRETNVPAKDKEYAQSFGVSRETIRDVRLNKYWRHIL